MIEAAATKQSRGVQHEAAGQILKLRAAEARDIGTNPPGALALLLAFVCVTQNRIPCQPL
jgi:hypothetical protein